MDDWEDFEALGGLDDVEGEAEDGWDEESTPGWSAWEDDEDADDEDLDEGEDGTGDHDWWSLGGGHAQDGTRADERIGRPRMSAWELGTATAVTLPLWVVAEEDPAGFSGTRLLQLFTDAGGGRWVCAVDRSTAAVAVVGWALRRQGLAWEQMRVGL